MEIVVFYLLIFVPVVGCPSVLQRPLDLSWFVSLCPEHLVLFVEAPKIACVVGLRLLT